MPKRTLLIIHIIFWVVNLTISFFLFQIQHLDYSHPAPFWKINIVTWAVTIGLFYAHYSILIPAFILNKKFILYAISLVILIILGTVLLGLNWNNFKWGGFPTPPHLLSKVAYAVFSHTFAGGALRMLDYFISSEKIKIELGEEVKYSELMYLKSQMSPHFLFNTLNNIYSLSLNKSDNTAKALSELKDLMSYIEDFKNGAKISIHKEIVHLKSFIALNDLRYGCKVNFDYKVEKDFDIEPLLLLPFLENAYKHGRTDDNSTIEVKLRSEESTFYFSVNNEALVNKRKDDVGGIGIKNIKRRLDLIYGSKQKLKSLLEGTHYSVSLNIEIT